MKPEHDIPGGAERGHEMCLECQRLLPQSDMVFINKRWICAECKPVFLQRLREGSGTEGISGKIWRDKDCVVMRIGTEMPDQCFKCNSPVTESKTTRKVSWLATRYFAYGVGGQALMVMLLLAFNVSFRIRAGLTIGGALFLIVACNFLCKRFSLRLALCRKHRRGQFWDRAASAFLLLATMLVLAVYALSSAKWIASILLVIGLIYVRIRSSRARTSLVADDHIWLKGAGPEFLAGLPEWPGKK